MARRVAAQAVQNSEAQTKEDTEMWQASRTKANQRLQPPMQR